MLNFQSYLYTGSNSTAYVESRLLNSRTIRHNQCEIAIVSDKSRCHACTSHRRSLRIMLTRLETRTESSQENRTAPSSRVNYSYLSTPETKQRLSRLHTSLRSAIFRVKARLEEAIDAHGVVVDRLTHDDLHRIMTENTPKVHDQYPSGSFACIFWEQQMNAAKAKSASGMRWHPLMIKWCLHLRHLSSSGYEALKKSGCISLPSQRTLRDYTHYAKAVSGFSMDVDQQLIDAANVRTCEEWKKCIVVLMDEMYIREDLVYNKVSGMLLQTL